MGRVISTNQKITDDGVLRIAQCGDGDDGREAAAVLANIRQLVDILDAAGRLENECLKPGCDRGLQFDAQGLGTRDDFSWIRDVRRSDLVDYIFGGVAKHALSTDIEDLYDAFCVGRNLGEVGTVKDGSLQCFSPKQRVAGRAATAFQRDGVQSRGRGGLHGIKSGWRRVMGCLPMSITLACRPPPRLALLRALAAAEIKSFGTVAATLPLVERDEVKQPPATDSVMRSSPADSVRGIRRSPTASIAR